MAPTSVQWCYKDKWLERYKYKACPYVKTGVGLHNIIRQIKRPGIRSLIATGLHRIHFNILMYFCRYMVIAKENGEFVTAKQYPKMLLISPSIHDNHVHFDAPAMETLKIPLAVSSINKPLVMCRSVRSVSKLYSLIKTWNVLPHIYINTALGWLSG